MSRAWNVKRFTDGDGRVDPEPDGGASWWVGEEYERGCEANLVSDLNNCGFCGNACMVAHGKASCINKACGVASCDAGFSDCDGKPGNGCEAVLKNDTGNCGACGNVCPINMAKCEEMEIWYK